MRDRVEAFMKNVEAFMENLNQINIMLSDDSFKINLVANKLFKILSSMYEMLDQRTVHPIPIQKKKQTIKMFRKTLLLFKKRIETQKLNEITVSAQKILEKVSDLQQSARHNIAIYIMGLNTVLREIQEVINQNPKSILVSVGSGNGHLEKLIQDKNPELRIVTIDPDPLSFYQEDSQEKKEYRPTDYETIQYLLQKEKKVELRNSILLLNWPTPPYDPCQVGTYDMEAIDKLRPKAVILIGELYGSGGNSHLVNSDDIYKGYIKSRKIMKKDSVERFTYVLDVFTKFEPRRDTTTPLKDSKKEAKESSPRKNRNPSFGDMDFH